MTKLLTPSQRPQRGELDEDKKKVSITGYLKLPVGRLPSGSNKTASSSSSSSAAAAGLSASSTAKKKTASSSSSSAAAAASASASASTGTKRKEVSFGGITGNTKKKRRVYVMWDNHPDILQAHVDARKNKQQVPMTTYPIYPPRTTINEYVKRLNNHEEATGEKLSVAEWIDQYKNNKGPNSIISDEVRDRIQNIIVARDGRNSPLKRKDILEIIASVAGCSQKQADNYYTYGVSHNKFPLLKKGGKVAAAQKTTTNRTQVTVEQQHRWHIVIDDIWEKQAERNLPVEEFKPVRAYFQLNLDEECIMGSDGSVRVISSIYGGKVQKNMDDYRGTITVIRIGSAHGGEGPVIFLCAAKNKSQIPLFLRGDLSEKHGLPPGSCVICTPTAYLTDAAWLECIPHICKGIHQMEVIRDHPDWLVALTLDGFSSHLQAMGYSTFNEYNIALLLEDGDTSQTNQAFDQQKAKEDKRNMRNLLDTTRSILNVQLDQWKLISVCIVALKRSTRSSWINSFIRVNLHPDHRLSFVDWIKKIESQVVAGESFFKCRTSLYDILPQFWKQMSVDDRNSVVTTIDGFYESDQPTWSKDNINELLEYVPLADVVRLRGCYWTAKTDGSVIYRVREEVVDSDRLCEVEFDEKSLRGVLDKFIWYPRAMNVEYGPRREWNRDSPRCRRETTTKVQEKWFKHITNNVASNHWAKYTTPLLPSSHINCEIDSDQHSFLNPTMSDVVLSTLEKDSYGENAKKKRARRRMCMVDGSARSYSKQLNSTARMEKYADQNALVGILASLQLEKDEDKKKSKEKKAEEKKQKERKNIAKELEREQNKIEAMPGIEFDVQQGLEHVLKKNMKELVKVLDYYYNENFKELNKMKRPELNILITAKMTTGNNNNNNNNNNNENIAS